MLANSPQNNNFELNLMIIYYFFHVYSLILHCRTWKYISARYKNNLHRRRSLVQILQWKARWSEMRVKDTHTRRWGFRTGFLLWNQLVLVVFHLFLLLNVQDAGEHTHTDTLPTQPASHPQFQASPVVRLQVSWPCWTRLEEIPALTRTETVWNVVVMQTCSTVVWRWSDHTLCFNDSDILTLFPSAIVASEAVGTMISVLTTRYFIDMNWNISFIILC